jgi:hypothetical protein
VVYLHAPLQVLQHRLLQRGATSGRSDDNINSIKKRFVTFKKESYPVIEYYERTTKSIVKRVCTSHTLLSFFYFGSPSSASIRTRTFAKHLVARTCLDRLHMTFQDKIWSFQLIPWIANCA